LEEFKRYAVFVLPDPGPLASFGAAWLGWDCQAGISRAHPDLPGLPVPVRDLTRTPRKYGFHGTIKPPFRLADGAGFNGLRDRLDHLAQGLQPVELGHLAVARIGGFLALTPADPSPLLAKMASTFVRELDAFRAAPGPEELARRRASGLTVRQDAMLVQWGYPYVLDQFCFHMTLTGRLENNVADATQAVLQSTLAPMLAEPIVVNSLALCGEATDGRFHLIHRAALSG